MSKRAFERIAGSIMPYSESNLDAGNPDPGPGHQILLDRQDDDSLATQAVGRGPLARIACNSCRSRKSKCDEQKPVCGTCRSMVLPCVYGKPRRPKLDTVLEDIFNSLTALELKSDLVISRLPSVVSVSSSSNDHTFFSPGWNTHLPSQDTTNLDPQDYSHDKYLRCGGIDKFKHATAAQKLYTWPCLQHIVAGMDPDYTINTELTREPLESYAQVPFCLHSSSESLNAFRWYDSMTLVQIRQLMDYYFQDLHLLYPVLDKETVLKTSLRKLLEQGVKDDSDSCLMLLIFALGSLAAYHHGQTAWSHEGMNSITNTIGLKFFNAARRILPFLPRGKCETAQCYILTGLYYSQTLRIHDFWFSIHEAAAILLSLFSVKSPGSCSADVVRSFWVAYILESNITAELDLPKSDLTHFEDIVPLPFGAGQDTVAHAEYQFVFLAHIALRRILNRVLESIYGTDQTTKLDPDLSNIPSSLISELISQLEKWLDCIPSTLSASLLPSLTLSSIDPLFYQPYPDNLLGQIKGRYWAARFIIHRPIVYKALHKPSDSLTKEDLKGVEECLTAGMNIPLQMGIMSEKPWLIASPFGPIRSFMATYTLACAVRNHRYLASRIITQWEVLEKMRRKIEQEFIQLSPILKEDFARMTRHRELH